MSTSISGAVGRRWPALILRARKSRWLREPLLHFIVIGAVLFALDAALVAREGDPKAITLSQETEAEAQRLFQNSRGRAPDTEELRALRQVWLDNEVLYREGLTMGLDRGDTAIRERVIFKALSMVDAGTRLPPYDEQTLRGWFEANRRRYDEPVRYDFEEAVLAGDNAESSIRTFVSALNSGGAPGQEAGLRVFKGRPHENLVQSYGEDLARELGTITRDEWRAVRSRDGWRALRVSAVHAAQAADFAALRGVVLQDWTDAQMAQQRSAAVRAIASKYHIEMPKP